MKELDLYHKYHASKEYTSIGLFRKLQQQFTISKVFYPGSHVHITPSLVFADVTYADSFRNTDKFFADAAVPDFIRRHREYPDEPRIRYYQQDYNDPFDELTLGEFDLVISQYAGFVGQAVKAYLKTGGLLVCNNSHGDASMAALDDDYQLIAVYQRRSDEKFTLSDNCLQDYLIPKKPPHATKEQLLKTMKGVAYSKSPGGYIFEKVS